MPVARDSCGVPPATVTGLLKTTWMEMTSPVTYVPSGVDEVTLETAGRTASMTMSLFPPRDPGVPGVASVRFAALLSASLIVPLLRASALVEA